MKKTKWFIIVGAGVLLFLRFLETQVKIRTQDTVALVTVSASGMYDPEVLARVVENRRAYCALRGYTCILSSEDVQKSCGGNVDVVAHLISPASWAKIPIMMQCLRSFTYVAWLDIDALIVKNFPITSLLTEPPCGDGWSFAVSGNDCDPTPQINAGYLVARSDERSHALLRAVLRISRNKTIREHYWWEQMAMSLILSKDLEHMRSSVCVAGKHFQRFRNLKCMQNESAPIVHWAGSRKDLPAFKRDFLSTPIHLVQNA